MDVSTKAVLAFLEEDNEQKVFFRLIPLADQDGLVRDAAVAQWPNEGGLRIVPDKNEQYHFKDRMRTLGSFCLMDLTSFPQEANKIRTNKNYNPDKGEINQFVIYSDCIKPLSDKDCFHVIETENLEDSASALSGLVSPKGYILCKSKYYGPVDKDDTVYVLADINQGKIYDIPCPDGKKRKFYWETSMQAQQPQEPLAEVKAKPKEEDVLEIGKPLQILDQTLAFEEQLENIAQPLSKDANLLSGSKHPKSMMQPLAPAQPLTGTPLYRGSAPRQGNLRTRNPLYEVVETQWRAARYEAPSAQIQQGADLRHVDNPVEKCRKALNTAWANQEIQPQVLNDILALPGITGQLKKILNHEVEGNSLAAAVRQQLQEIEAERLSLLLQLDKAKENVAGFREESLASLTKAKRQELDALEIELQKDRQVEASLKKQLNDLYVQRQTLESTIDQLQANALPEAITKALICTNLCTPMKNIPVRVTAQSGIEYTLKEISDKLQKDFAASGTPIANDEAINWLILLAMCPRIQLVHASLGSALRYGETVCHALGGNIQCVEMETQQAIIDDTKASPALSVLATPYLRPEVHGAHVMLLSKSLSMYVDSAAYGISPWPVVACKGDIPTQHIENAESVLPVAKSALKKLLAHEQALPTKIEAWLEEVRSICKDHQVELSVQLWENFELFLKSAAKTMEGGWAVACDYAIAQWLAPVALECGKLAAALLTLVAGLPMSQALLNKQDQ